MSLQVKNAKLETNFEYIPLSQKGEDSPFTIRFEALKLDNLAELQDSAIRIDKDGNYSVSINSLNYAVLKAGLTDWENISDDKGHIRFKRDNNGATDSSLALIPGDIRNELATIIVEVSKDLPNAEEYLAELEKLSAEDSDYVEEIVEEKPVKKPRAKKAASEE